VAKADVNKLLAFALTLHASHPYFEERGVSPELVEVFGLGYCDKGTSPSCSTGMNRHARRHRNRPIPVQNALVEGAAIT
jgi:hypothetical protein